MTTPLNACGQEHSHGGAIRRGYTRPITVSHGAQDLFLMVEPDADLDDTFKAFDTDACEMIAVNGWECSIADGH